MGFDTESRRFLDGLGLVNLELLITSISIRRFSIDGCDLFEDDEEDLEKE